MGKTGRSSQEYQQGAGKSKRKSKGRMSYLKRNRTGGGGEGGSGDAKMDEHGQLYGDYAPAYGGKSGWRNNRGGGGGRRAKEYLKAGMKGFMCTTNFREKDCVREAYNILNEYCEGTESSGPPTKDVEGEKVKAEGGSEEGTGTSSQDCKSNETDKNEETPMELPSKSDEDEDVDEALANELKDLKSEKAIRKFQSVDAGVTNVVFISTTIENPTELAYQIFEDVLAKKQTKSKHLLRLMPIEMTCHAMNMDEVKSKAKDVFEKYLKTGYNSYKIVVNVRLNTKVKRDDLIKSLADVVSQVNPLNVVSLNDPKFTIVVEVLKTTLCLSVVKEFVKFKKYNLLEAGANPTPAVVATESDSVKSETEIQPQSTESTEVGEGTEESK